ncbi:MAG: endo-1,4-beta-xylanase [Chloroflexota bacterium]
MNRRSAWTLAANGLAAVWLAAGLALGGCRPTAAPPGAGTPQPTAVEGTAGVPGTTAPGAALSAAPVIEAQPSPTPAIPVRAALPVHPIGAIAPHYPDCLPDPVEPYHYNAGRYAALPVSGEITPTLRSLAEARGMYIGTSTDPSVFDDPGLAGLTAQQANILAVETAMRWDVIHPEPGRYDFSAGDTIVDFAHANGMQVYAHMIAWDLLQPDWLTGGEGRWSRDEWVQILCRHVQTVVGRYRGQVYAWNVVNEPFQNSGELRDTLWLRAIGPEYIAMAFYYARQADPGARLVLNEHFAEGMNEKSDAVYRLAAGMLEAGLPLDAIGLQMHVWLYGPPSKAELEANMQRLAALGLQVHITEMDVRLQYIKDPPAKELAEQALVYRNAMAACLKTPACNVFITWGINDGYNWITPWTGVTDYPVLFDRQLQPKPAYAAVVQALQSGP